MVDKYIREILVEYGKVYVPRLGLILKNVNTSGDSAQNEVLTKPSFHYSIDPSYVNEEDTWLTYAIARGEHISLEDSEKAIKDRVDEIKMFLEEGQKVEIEGVGTLTISSGNIEFLENTFTEIVEDESFGIPSFINTNAEGDPVDENIGNSAYSGKSEENFSEREREIVADNSFAEPEREERNIYLDEIPEYEQEEKKSKVGLIAAIIAFVLIGLGVTYYFLQPQSDKYEELSSVSQNDTESEMEDSSEMTNTSLTNDAVDENTDLSVNKPLAIKEAGKRYYIIVGAFSISENAEKYKRALGSKGLKSKVIKAKEADGLYRVSLADFEEFQEALTQTESLKKQYGNSIWILKY